MPALEQSIVIAATKEDLFDLSQNYSLRLHWDPYLRVAEVENNATPAVGVRVYCESKKRIGMWVEYITYKRPNFTAMKMIKGPFLFKHFAGSWRFEQADPTHTTVRFRYNYECRGGKVFNMILSPIIRRLLVHDMATRLQGLKASVENSSILKML